MSPVEMSPAAFMRMRAVPTLFGAVAVALEALSTVMVAPFTSSQAERPPETAMPSICTAALSLCTVARPSAPL